MLQFQFLFKLKKIFLVYSVYFLEKRCKLSTTSFYRDNKIWKKKKYQTDNNKNKIYNIPVCINFKFLCEYIKFEKFILLNIKFNKTIKYIYRFIYICEL